MPWYWSDDIAAQLISIGKISESVADDLRRRPVAFRVEAGSLEMAADMLLDDDEIPLAA